MPLVTRPFSRRRFLSHNAVVGSVGKCGEMISMGSIDPLRVRRSALENGDTVAGLLLTTDTLVAEQQTPSGGSRALMTGFGRLDEGLHRPSSDSSNSQSLGLGT